MPENAHHYKLLTGARVIDGTGGPPIGNGAVLVHGSRVAAVGPANTFSAPDGASVEQFEYPGKTIMPGMVDCHTHHNGWTSKSMAPEARNTPIATRIATR